VGEPRQRGIGERPVAHGVTPSPRRP
jgi:hypothetical protein